jgi:hypothetical protein
VQIGGDGPDDNLAGIETHTDLDQDAMRAEDFLAVSLHALLHPQGRVAGPHGMILVGERRPEERHDPVPHHLVDRSLVAVHGLHHVLEHGVEQLPGLLGIAVGEKLHRAPEIGEEYRHLLALPFKGALRRENLLGEVFRGVGLRRIELRLRAGGGWAERSAASAAEFLTALVQEAA